MSKHTPIPWELYEDGENGICLNGGRNMEIIIAEKINQADRHILHAAPELLGAIKGFFKAKNAEEKHHAMVRMEEAIAKAEGK